MYIKTAYNRSDYGQIRSDTVGYGQIRSDTVGYGRIRSDTVGYGQIRSDTVTATEWLRYGYGTATGAGKNRKNYCTLYDRTVIFIFANGLNNFKRSLNSNKNIHLTHILKGSY
jgi:hypothetical protein